MNIRKILDRFKVNQESLNKRTQSLVEFCQPFEHVWVADSFHQGFGCGKCSYSYWDWSQEKLKMLTSERTIVPDDSLGLASEVIGAARALIAAPHCQKQWASFGHEKCSLGFPCDTHCWHLLKHTLFLLDNPILTKYQDFFGNVICPNCHAQNGHTPIDGKPCPGYPESSTIDKKEV